ncbi:hypothetical protein PoB_001199700 [Plakobranchus ocellatus]|uniref:Uncharacterized protein n=1 Tax=Plakobranchus ocellatus TaxID=259542 RepID=A0AAV3YTN3_9GAST|nr:hypothetical protein PoB_001199700 [Plakobranchus ocellatus]
MLVSTKANQDWTIVCLSRYADVDNESKKGYPRFYDIGQTELIKTALMRMKNRNAQRPLLDSANMIFCFSRAVDTRHRRVAFLSASTINLLRIVFIT